MSLATLLALLLPLVAAASFSWALHWIWTPFWLVRCFQRQGIPGFTAFRVSHLAENDSASVWEILSSAQKNGKIFYLRFGKFVRLIVLDPVFIQQVLVLNTDCYEKPSFVKALEILGNGLFRTSGREWESQRQLFGPCFLSKELKGHFENIKGCATSEMENWDADLYLKQDEVDIHKKFLQLTVKLIGRIAFGDNIDSNSAADIFERFDRYLHNHKRLLCNPCYSLPGYSQRNKKIMEDERHLLLLIKELLKRRKSQAASSIEDNKKGLLIDLMMNSECTNEEFSNKLTIDNSATFLLAGHETTASLLTWTVYLLAVHSLWQERARAEIFQILEVQDLEWKNLSQFKTLNMILWESLRLFPPQSIIGRLCIRENTVQNILIPENTEVIVPVSAVHRDKEIWGEDSEEFRPARFANGINKACENPLAFLPFGEGPRTCIGQALALLEARIILSYMLRKYSWELSPSYRHCPDVTLTLQPRFGMPITLVKL